MSNDSQGSARWATVRNGRMTAKAGTLTRTGSMPAAFLEWRTQSPIITYNVFAEMPSWLGLLLIRQLECLGCTTLVVDMKPRYI